RPGAYGRDRGGEAVGTGSGLARHPESRQVVALVVQQGIVDRREIVAPLNVVAKLENDEVRLTLAASELAGRDLFDAPDLRPMPEHWPMPAGFAQRSFFLVPDASTAAVLPLPLTSAQAPGPP